MSGGSSPRSSAAALTDIERRIVEMIRYIGVKAGVAEATYGEMCHEARCILRNAHLDYDTSLPSSAAEKIAQLGHERKAAVSALSREQIEQWLEGARDPQGHPGWHPQTNGDMRALCELALSALQSETRLTDRSPAWAEWVWWEAGPDGGFRVGPRDKGCIAIVFTIEEAQELCKTVNEAMRAVLVERGELALKLAGAECFIEEQRKKGNIK